MLTQAQRTAILELNAKGVSRREIARVLKVSRLTVRKVPRSDSTAVPELHRAEKAEPYRQQILELLLTCKGNLVRVHEELEAGGASLSYTALTAFCRRHGIGQPPMEAAGQYHWARMTEAARRARPEPARSAPPGAAAGLQGRRARLQEWRCSIEVVVALRGDLLILNCTVEQMRLRGQLGRAIGGLWRALGTAAGTFLLAQLEPNEPRRDEGLHVRHRRAVGNAGEMLLLRHRARE